MLEPFFGKWKYDRIFWLCLAFFLAFYAFFFFSKPPDSVEYMELGTIMTTTTHGMAAGSVFLSILSFLWAWGTCRMEQSEKK